MADLANTGANTEHPYKGVFSSFGRSNTNDVRKCSCSFTDGAASGEAQKRSTFSDTAVVEQPAFKVVRERET